MGDPRRLASLFRNVKLAEPWMDAGSGGPATQGINAPYVSDRSTGGMPSTMAMNVEAGRDAIRSTGATQRFRNGGGSPARIGASVQGLMSELPASDHEIRSVPLVEPWMDAGAGGPASQGVNSPYVKESITSAREIPDLEEARRQPSQAERFKMPQQGGSLSITDAMRALGLIP